MPESLREALSIQDGGYVRGADLYVNPLEQMKPLSEGEWDHLWESSENQQFGDPEKLVILGSHESLGGILILDGNTAPEPRILYLWRDLGDELRDEDDTSFDDLVDRLRQDVEILSPTGDQKNSRIGSPFGSSFTGRPATSVRVISWSIPRYLYQVASTSLGCNGR